VPVFARGGLWTPLDIVSLQAPQEELRDALETFGRAGMNMVRVPGFGPYEQAAFHELCDELGILVWQDLMFASMDYPFEDPDFGRVCEREVADLAERLAARPSSAVVCGNSEVEQQVAMLGLDMGLVRIPFYDEAAPRLLAGAGLEAVYVPSSPFGGDLPMQPDRGVTNYYGVGGYRQPLSDARTSGLRFAGESLAFANIPDDDALAALVPEPPFEPFMHHPRWKAGVARDAGSGWDFDDLRDHYLRVVYGVDPLELRRDDTTRYLELSRVVTAELMAHAYGEWRRSESPCAGALILWWRDLVPGAGYGVVDNRGRPKTPWYALARSLAPAAVWLVDERTGGVVAHVANDGPEPLRARLRIRLFSDLETEVGGGEVPLDVPARGAVQHNVETVVGHFVDAAWAFRFGPPAQDAIVASLGRDGAAGPELLSQAFHFPAGWPLNQEPARRLGLTAAVDRSGDSPRVVVASKRLAYAVRIHVPGFTPADDAFSVEPGGTRTIALRAHGEESRFEGGWLTGLNLAGQVPITQPGVPS
jgi:beta-mannosidase